MKTKKISTMTWDEAPDTITPEDLSKILGIGIIGARNLFDKTDFPKISKGDIGNVGKADKEAVRLYIQGFRIKENSRNAMEYMILLELKRLNKLIESKEKVNCSNV